MTARRLKPSDIPILQAMAEASGWPYPPLVDLEMVCVVVDENDRPLMAAGVKKILETYLWVGDIKKPLARMHALRVLHAKLESDLRSVGFREANAFLPPTLASRFGRRLERSFGWRRNWESWFLRF